MVHVHPDHKVGGREPFGQEDLIKTGAKPPLNHCHLASSGASLMWADMLSDIEPVLEVWSF